MRRAVLCLVLALGLSAGACSMKEKVEPDDHGGCVKIHRETAFGLEVIYYRDAVKCDSYGVQP